MALVSMLSGSSNHHAQHEVKDSPDRSVSHSLSSSDSHLASRGDRGSSVRTAIDMRAVGMPSRRKSHCQPLQRSEDSDGHGGLFRDK